MIIFVIWLAIGILHTKVNPSIGGWLSMMGFNYPKITIFVLLPLTWLLWPLFVWRWK